MKSIGFRYYWWYAYFNLLTVSSYVVILQQQEVWWHLINIHQFYNGFCWVLQDHQLNNNCQAYLLGGTLIHIIFSAGVIIYTPASLRLCCASGEIGNYRFTPFWWKQWFNKIISYYLLLYISIIGLSSTGKIKDPNRLPDKTPHHE